MPRPKINLKNKRFGRLVVIAETEERRNKYVVWLCKCDCGNQIKVQSSYLLDKRTGYGRKSCGCLMSDIKKKHGHTNSKGFRSKTYKSWDSMKQRCLNPNNKKYFLYGGRGITICERWLEENGFENFLADMGERPEGKTLDRIDNDGNYEPSNCKWSTIKEQNNNRRGLKNVKLPED